MHAEFEQMKTILEENLLFMSLASGWEEYGEERNAHIHLLLQADAKNRLRLTQWKTAIRDQLKITVTPHIDIVTANCPNAQILNYRLKEGKAAQWTACRQTENDPGFFLFSTNNDTAENHRGQRTDIFSALQDCADVDELVVKHPDVACKGLATFSRYYDQLNALKMANTTFDTHSYWLFGDSGTGKSTLCGKLAERCLGEGETYFRHTSGDYQWWNGYAGQKVVIMEELRRNKLKAAGGLA